MTNFQKFKLATNHYELAKLLYKFDNQEPFQCEYCDIKENSNRSCSAKKCSLAISKWLQGEYKDEI